VSQDNLFGKLENFTAGSCESTNTFFLGGGGIEPKTVLHKIN